MIEIKDNIFTHNELDAICITTNLCLRKNGDGICGAGVAKAAKKLIPNLEQKLGESIRSGIKTSTIITEYKDKKIISFPTKYKWMYDSDIGLIENSMYSLMAIIDKYDFKNVGLPRPGCSNGRLEWNCVKDSLDKITNNTKYESIIKIFYYD